MIFLAMGCARDVYPPLCKHNALLAAAVISGLYPDDDVRIDFGPRLDEYSAWHVQAKVKIKGEWKWLQVRNGVVFIGNKEPFNNLNSYTLKDYFNHYFIERNRGD